MVQVRGQDRMESHLGALRRRSVQALQEQDSLRCIQEAVDSDGKPACAGHDLTYSTAFFELLQQALARVHSWVTEVTSLPFIAEQFTSWGILKYRT